MFEPIVCNGITPVYEGISDSNYTSTIVNLWGFVCMFVYYVYWVPVTMRMFECDYVIQ